MLNVEPSGIRCVSLISSVRSAFCPWVSRMFRTVPICDSRQRHRHVLRRAGGVVEEHVQRVGVAEGGRR